MKPILFNSEMTHAILDGRKTQTRRVVKPQPISPRSGGMRRNDKGVFYGWYEDGIRVLLMAKPLYQPGDILWVRETWAPGATFATEGKIFYKADDDYADNILHWHPSIHMPRKYARIFLRVTDVRVERLWDSFNAPTTPILAIQAEGIDIGDTCRECIDNYGFPCCVDAVDDDGSTLAECGILDENRGEFSDLWDSTIKPADRDRYGWEANPWVWVYTFERIEKGE